jgi:hypothetical protein
VPIVRRPSATRPARIPVIDFIVIVPLTQTSSAILLAGNNFQFRFPIRESDVWNLAVLTRNELVASAFAVGCERVSGEAESLKVTDGNQYLAKPRKVGVKSGVSDPFPLVKRLPS